MGKLMNLSILSLLYIVVSVSGVVEYSRLSLTLIHWDSNANGSYLKLKNNPLRYSYYNITISTDNSDVLTQYTVDSLFHDISGLAQVPLRWAGDALATQLNISVTEDVSSDPNIGFGQDIRVSVQSTVPADGSKVVYYPRDHQIAKVSLVQINASWTPTWDNDVGQIWLLNGSDPQQVEVLEITATSLTVSCFVCKSGISSELGDYVVTLTSDSNDTITLSLNDNKTDSQGNYQALFGTAFEAVTYNLTFNMNYKGKVRTSLVVGGNASTLLPPSLTYKSVYQDGPLHGNVYFNEIRFPSLNANITDANSLWIEIIGPANTSLSNYCIFAVGDFPNSNLPAYTVCIPLGGRTAATTGNGYYIWSLGAATAQYNMDQLYTFFNSTVVEPKLSLYLQRDDQVSMTTVDRFSFVWAADPTSGGCVGDSKLSCLQKSGCDFLCLNPTNLLQKSGRGMSRCGIQKDPALAMKNTTMTVWRVEPITKKRWNSCEKPSGHLTRLALDDNKITIRAMRDTEDLIPSKVMNANLHLPNMGLQFTFWQSSLSHITSPTLKGADLTIDRSADDSPYPMTEMNITLTKNGETSVSGAELYASGAVTKSFVKPFVYVIALVHHYSFLPAFDINRQQDQVVDAVVYSPAGVPLEISTVSKFMSAPILDQGQLVLDKSAHPVIVNLNDTQGQMSSWQGFKPATNEYYKLDRLAVAHEVQRYLRIMRVGNNLNPKVQLKLVGVPAAYTPFLDQGLSLETLCLTVYVSSGNRQQTVAMALMADSISLGETVEVHLAASLAGDNVYPNTHSAYVTLFIDSNQSPTEICPHPFFTPINGSAYPKDRAVDIVDMLEIGYDSSNPSAVIISDTTEGVRCNSMKAFYSPAFAVVPLKHECPVPHDLYIYKLCHKRIGIASDRTDYRPFPTDYLYLLQLDDDNKVLNITSLLDLSALLKWKHNVVQAPNFVIVSSDKVTSFSLSWYPNKPPAVNSTVTNSTLNVVVAYPTSDILPAAERRLTSILQTAESYDDAHRPVVMYAPHVKDRRHCVIGCDRLAAMDELIDFETENYKIEDKTCEVGYTQQYRNVRINEINVDTPGFKDAGEFIELKGAAGFKYASGLSIALLSVEDGDVIYKDMVNVTDDNKMFDSNGYFLFEHTSFNKSWSSLPSLQSLPYYRFIPNQYGAIALLWGSQLVQGVGKHFHVIDSHMTLPDLFLDVVIYAKNQETAQDKDVKRLFEVLSKNPAGLKGTVGIETLGAVNNYETISRCFCSDPFDMSCFEMSFNETKRSANHCPTLYSKKMQFCTSADAVSDDHIAMDIEEFMADDIVCNNMSCSFSKYQVKSFSTCTISTKESTQLRSFVVGFPTEEQLDRVGPLITAESLKSFGADYVTLCPEATCPPPAASPHSNNAVIVGAVLGGLALVTLVVVIVVLLKKRQKRMRHLSARYEAGNNEEDDDTFLPDNGSISFSNPWYNNQSNGSALDGNENGSKKQYQKLSTST